MLGVAVVGALANLAGLLVLRPAQAKSLNMRGAYLEVLGDLVGSLAVIVAAVLILITGWTLFDRIASLLIVVVIIPRAWSLLREVVDVLLEATPHGVDLAEVRDHIKRVRGVVDVHDLHAWTITSGVPVLSAHVIVDTPASARAARARCWTGSANASAGISMSPTAPSSSSRLATRSTRPPTTLNCGLSLSKPFRAPFDKLRAHGCEAETHGYAVLHSQQHRRLHRRPGQLADLALPVQRAERDGRSAIRSSSRKSELWRWARRRTSGSLITPASSIDPSKWEYTIPTWVFSSRELPRVEGPDIRFVSGDVAPVHEEMVRVAEGRTSGWWAVVIWSGSFMIRACWTRCSSASHQCSLALARPCCRAGSSRRRCSFSRPPRTGRTS